MREQSPGMLLDGAELAALLEGMQSISSSLELDEVLERGLASVAALVASNFAVLIRESGRSGAGLVVVARLVDGRVVVDERPLESCERVSAPLVRRALHAGRTQLEGGLACVPLTRDGSTLGLLVVDAPEGDESSRARALGVLELLASQLAIALSHAERHAGVRDSEQKLWALLDNTNAVVFIKDLEGRYELVNKQLEHDTGVPREQMLGKNDYELFSRETAERLRADDRRVLDSGEIEQLEGVTEFPSGPRVFLSTKFPLRGPDGQIYGLGGVATDITERKRAEQAIAAREHNLRITLDAIHDAVIVTDAEGRVTRMNPAAERLTGWRVAEACGRSFDEVARIEPPREQGHGYPVLLDRDHDHGHDRRHDRRHVDRRHVTRSDAPIVDGQGRRVGVVTVLRDVSERERLEAQLRNSHKLDALGRLAGGIAHDFNNMLTAILASTELLDMVLPARRGAAVDQALRTVIDAAEQAAELTRKLLVFSREGHRPSELVDLHDTVEAAVGLLQRSIDRRIRIELRLDARGPVLVGDAARLQAALLNLGVNARDAMPEGGRISVSTRDLHLSPAACEASPFALRPGPYVELEIRDTGVGIDEAALPHIFEPFFTTKKLARGAGLGLSTVHGTVVEHGGAIHVHSELGRGTSVVLQLPSSGEVEPKVELSPSRGGERNLGGRGRILLVDDEPVVRESGARMLESLGYEVALAEDGCVAVTQYAAHHEQLDLVLLDMIMPNMGGYEAYLAMQEIDASVPIIVCSGYAAGDAVRALQERGLAGFLAKPYRLAQLEEFIARHLRRAADA